MGQYFTNDESLGHNEKIIKFQTKNNVYNLQTDSGVFSKNSVDFGTRVLLNTLLPMNLTGKVLDIGCGYGALGLVLAGECPDIKLTCIDVNMRALALCKSNAHKLGLGPRVTCLQSDVYEKIEEKYDVIVSNPPIRAGKRVTYRIYEGARDYMLENGRLFIVIRKAQGAESVKKYLEDLFGNCTLLKREKGYHVLMSTLKSDNKNLL